MVTGVVLGLGPPSGEVGAGQGSWEVTRSVLGVDSIWDCKGILAKVRLQVAVIVG